MPALSQCLSEDFVQLTEALRQVAEAVRQRFTRTNSYGLRDTSYIPTRTLLPLEDTFNLSTIY